MNLKIVTASFLFLCLDVIANVSHQCTSNLFYCTKRMTRMLGNMEDKSSLCRIIDIYIHCIEAHCNEFLSPCDTNKFKNSMLSRVTDCKTHLTPLTIECIHETSSTTSLWPSTHLILFTTLLCCLLFKSHISY